MARRKPLDPLTTSSLTEVLDELGIRDNDWDALLVGDGSGTNWKNSIGWASVLVDHYGNYRAPFFGMSNTGTSTLAEMMPYLFAMAWYSSGPGKPRLAARRQMGQFCQVHIITDSNNLANQGNGLARRIAYPEIWRQYDGYTAAGYAFTWHWVARQRVGLNRLVDVVAGRCRVLAEKLSLPDGQLIRDLNLYELNPIAFQENDNGLECNESETSFEDKPTTEPNSS